VTVAGEGLPNHRLHELARYLIDGGVHVAEVCMTIATPGWRSDRDEDRFRPPERLVIIEPPGAAANAILRIIAGTTNALGYFFRKLFDNDRLCKSLGWTPRLIRMAKAL
jgi:hypothetical protein